MELRIESEDEFTHNIVDENGIVIEECMGIIAARKIRRELERMRKGKLS